MSKKVQHTLNNKQIVVGVTGGIAAYKSAELTRRLMEAGAQVKIVMTSAATSFVTPLTFSALSNHQVYVDERATEQENISDSTNSNQPSAMQHIELARWADAIIVVPASANTIAKLAYGQADNILTTLCLASKATKFFAPAMNRVMWADESTQQNCTKLLNKDWIQLGPDTGLQACGETGEGRLLAVPIIMNELLKHFQTGELQGLQVTISAGPTYEAIDPVRFIGNRSSGRMGYALVQAAKNAGASVTLVSGPSFLAVPDNINFIAVESAQQMLQAVLSSVKNCDIYISTAAVADYRLKQIASQKIKKTEDAITLELIKNVDILSQVAQSSIEKGQPYVVGFAAETENIVHNAKQKLKQKKLDMMVVNDVSDDASKVNKSKGIGFNSVDNAVHVLWCDDKNKLKIDGEHYFEKTKKTQLATKLISLISEQYHKKIDAEKINSK